MRAKRLNLVCSTLELDMWQKSIALSFTSSKQGKGAELYMQERNDMTLHLAVIICSVSFISCGFNEEGRIQAW